MYLVVYLLKPKEIKIEAMFLLLLVLDLVD